MDFVQNEADLLKNVETLRTYLKSTDSEEVHFAQRLIHQGLCFVVVKTNGELEFFPSRFMGYLNNTKEKHEANRSKDGKLTNPAISRILHGKPVLSNAVWQKYKCFCEAHGITPSALTERKPKFWERVIPCDN